MRKGGRTRWSISVAVTATLLGSASSGMAQEPPSPPTDEALDAAILKHHPDLMDRPLGDGRQVWFVLDSEGEIAATGIDAADGLEEKIEAEYPSVTPGYAFRVDHITVNGRFIPILWLIPALDAGPGIASPYASTVPLREGSEIE